MIERAMVVTAHPDDAETGAAGTVAKLVRQGVEVTYVIVTKGLCLSPCPQLAVDISETMELKLKAIACHRSQFPDFPKMAAYVRARCAALGKSHGYAYAETFDRILLSR